MDMQTFATGLFDNMTRMQSVNDVDPSEWNEYPTEEEKALVQEEQNLFNKYHFVDKIDEGTAYKMAKKNAREKFTTMHQGDNMTD